MKRRLALSALALLPLCACKLWTVVPIEQANRESAQPAARFDARRYVDSIWTARVLPTALDRAAPLAYVLGALRANPAAAARRFGYQRSGDTVYFLVSGRSRVLKVDTASRSGTLAVDIAPFDGRPDATVQIGPVIQGMALRDSLPFIQFSQFVNQLEFARVGNELNDRVVQNVLAPLDRKWARGAWIDLCGAFAQPEAGALPLIVPVKLALEAGGAA